MTFVDLLKKIKGLKARWNNGTCNVEEVYWSQNKALIHLDEGTKYYALGGRSNIHMEFISDGYDRIVVDLDELIQFNTKR